MKISVVGKMKNKRLSIGYRMFILSMLKKALFNFDKEYFDSIFMYEGKKTKKAKPFTFSMFFRDFKINSDFIEVNGEVKIIISSPDKKLIMILLGAFMQMKSYGELIDIKVNVEKEKVIKDEVAILKTLSPIYIKDENNKPVSIEDERYNEKFNYFANVIISSYRGYGLKKELTFMPIKMKKAVVKEEINGFKEKTGKKYIYFNAYSGVFKLEGDVEDLNLLKELGVGARRSGFGTIDLY